MIDLRSFVVAIEKLLEEDSAASLTYAALECRLAIEAICYERLRLNHDYISHKDLKKWTPAYIVKMLLQNVDPDIETERSLSAAVTPPQKIEREPTESEHEAMPFEHLGTQSGFSSKYLGELWNALGGLALHVAVPESREANIPHYGNLEKIRDKVCECLAEIRRVGKGTMLSSASGQDISFECYCGQKNKRKFALLSADQFVRCMNPTCDESYDFIPSTMSFKRRTVDVHCDGTDECTATTSFAALKIDNLGHDQFASLVCNGCQKEIYLRWQLVTAKQATS